jgi:CDP-diacylglycerol--glycerol-3-phosphate 3-phosphatidyltransferase
MSLPNQLTVLRIALTPLLAVFLTLEDLTSKYIAFGIFILATMTDWYDGYIARKYGSTTVTGKYLDPLADKLLVSTVFGVFTYLGAIPFWMFAIIVLRDIVITGLRAYAHSKGKLFETSNIAKWKTASQMLAIYFLFFDLIFSAAYRGEAAPALLTYVEDANLLWNYMLFVTLYTLATGISYLYDNRHHLKSLAIDFYRVFIPTNVR